MNMPDFKGLYNLQLDPICVNSLHEWNNVMVQKASMKIPKQTVKYQKNIHKPMSDTIMF